LQLGVAQKKKKGALVWTGGGGVSDLGKGKKRERKEIAWLKRVKKVERETPLPLL